jgi:hypothetical protein
MAFVLIGVILCSNVVERRTQNSRYHPMWVMSWWGCPDVIGARAPPGFGKGRTDHVFGMGFRIRLHISAQAPGLGPSFRHGPHGPTASGRRREVYSATSPPEICSSSFFPSTSSVNATLLHNHSGCPWTRRSNVVFLPVSLFNFLIPFFKLIFHFYLFMQDGI